MGPNDRKFNKPPQRQVQQNHILADLRGRYGEKMIELGEQDLDNDFKILGLIRSIFSGNFDYSVYGEYLAYPSILDRLYQVANSYLIQHTIHYYATESLQWNQEALQRITIPVNCIYAVCNKDRDTMSLWEIIVQGFTSIYQSNGNIAGLQSAVQYASGLHCSDGRTPLVRLL